MGKTASSLVLFFLVLGSFPAGATVAQKNLLSNSFSIDRLEKILITRADWRAFPRADERTAWSSLPEEVRRVHIERGEKALGASWELLPAALFLEYARNGNRSNYESVRRSRRNRLQDLVVAECMEGRGRFVEEIVNGVWATCEETYWGVPAHMSLQKAGPGLADVEEPTVDLFAAETGSLLAWTDYLLGPHLDRVSPLVRQRIYVETNRRILSPNLQRDDFWWMGFAGRRVNNWNPWINSNWLTCVLLLERDEARRGLAVHKVLRSLDQFLNDYPADGGCDEGPGYWNRAGGSLFDCLELLYSASDGSIDVYSVPLIGEIGRYIYRAHIANRYFINFADASARITISGDLVYRYGKRIGDERMMGLGALAAQQEASRWELSDSIGRQLAALFNLSEVLAAKAFQPLLGDVWLPDIQVMAARSEEGSAQGLYLAAKGGHNAESHNHNDVGNFIVYADGQPAIIDVGVETYTAKTFSARRYEIWTMQSAYHNLPTMDGVMQKEGRAFAAREARYQANDAVAELTLDIAGAYPAEAGLQSWQRTFRLVRGKAVEVVDTYVLSKPARPLTLTLMTPCAVALKSPGMILLKGAAAYGGGSSREVTVHYDPGKLAPNLEEIRVEDSRLKSVWGNRLTRILLRADHPSLKDTLNLRITQ